MLRHTPPSVGEFLRPCPTKSAPDDKERINDFVVLADKKMDLLISGLIKWSFEYQKIDKKSTKNGLQNKTMVLYYSLV